MSYLTKEQRLEAYEHMGTYFTFKTCADLSNGVYITQRHSLSKERYSNVLASETASFIVSWTIQIHRFLNGFSGMDTVDFIVE